MKPLVLGLIAVGVLALALVAWPSRTLAQAPTATPGATVTPSPTPADLIVDGRTVELYGALVFRRFVVRNRGRVTIGPYDGGGDTGRLFVNAEWIEVDGTSSILGDAAGYRGRSRQDGEGPGGGEGGRNAIDGAGGGGHGGRGGDGVRDGVGQSGARGGREVGDDRSPEIDMGSAGGSPGTADNPNEGGSGSRGGAAVRLVAATVLMSGTISVNGADGEVTAMDAAGGGAGGGVLIQAGRLSLSGRIDANGGAGGETDDGGGGGGGGRIKAFCQDGNVVRRSLRVTGGKGDGNGLPNDGEPGSVYIACLPATPTPTARATSTATATATASPTDPATATATATDTPTPTVTASATPTATFTDTPPPTPTATPTPAPLYLPLVLAERCPIVDYNSLTLVFVIDASLSMTEPEPGGRTKLAAALAAVRVPIDLLWRPGDSIGLVTFNREATVVARPTADKAALYAALDRVRAGAGSRLDAGVRAGTELLAAVPPRFMVRRLVVLTDGLPNPSTPADALAAAEAARAQDIVVETIGLGADADPALLRAMASTPALYHFAPGPDELLALFQDLAWVPPVCGGLQGWPRTLSAPR